MWRAWEASAREDWSAWGKFEPLASSGRTIYASRKNPPPDHHFGESLIAQRLEDDGYRTWGGGVCGIAQSDSELERQVVQTQIVKDLLRLCGLPVPTDYRSRVDFTMRQPDITAFHEQRGWRFAEVKLDQDRTRPGQVDTLAFLHDLLGAEVEIVRVLPEGTQIKHREMACTYTLTA
jgi:hypothetical protein